MGIFINKIELGLDRYKLKPVKMFSEFMPKNVLTYMKTPERTGDATLRNESIDSYYIPQVEFMFNYLTPEEFSEIIQVLNTKGFVVKYYDIEIMKTVVRLMYMTKNELSRLLAYGGKYRAALQSRFTMVSKLGYDDYADLTTKALTDDRVA